LTIPLNTAVRIRKFHSEFPASLLLVAYKTGKSIRWVRFWMIRKS